jgi:type IV secretory pathway VirB2 component (pilin)
MLSKFNLSDLKVNSDLAFRIFTFFCVTIMIFSYSNDIFADPTGPTGGGGDTNTADVFGSALCGVVSALSGKVAKAIATAGIFATAIGFFSGKLQWQTVAVLSIGIVTIFSAGSLVGWLSGGNASGGCPTT